MDSDVHLDQVFPQYVNELHFDKPVAVHTYDLQSLSCFSGYVGPGMASAAVSGPIFTSPPPGDILAALRAIGRGNKGRPIHCIFLQIQFSKGSSPCISVF